MDVDGDGAEDPPNEDDGLLSVEVGVPLGVSVVLGAEDEEDEVVVGASVVVVVGAVGCCV